jgi:hypothetical protein
MRHVKNSKIISTLFRYVLLICTFQSDLSCGSQTLNEQGGAGGVNLKSQERGCEKGKGLGGKDWYKKMWEQSMAPLKAPQTLKCREMQMEGGGISSKWHGIRQKSP